MKQKPENRGFTVLAPAGIVFILAVICVVLVGLYAFTPASYISAMEVSAQDVGGVKATNYMPILEDDVDWEALGDDSRAEIARYAVNTAIEQAAKSGVTTFNVIGIARPQEGQSQYKDEPVFLYTGGTGLYIYVNGEPSLIPLTE